MCVVYKGRLFLVMPFWKSIDGYDEAYILIGKLQPKGHKTHFHIFASKILLNFHVGYLGI